MQLAMKSNDDVERRSHPNPLDNTFTQLAKDTLTRWNVPGIAIGVVDGEADWHQGYGLRDVSSKDPVTPDTNFYAGSTTKAFTALALAQLVSDPSLPEVQWNTPVSSLIREDFVVGDAWTTAHLTLEDILTHRTGMPVHDQAHGRLPLKDTPHDAPRPQVREITRQLRHLPLTAEPRTVWQYCNIMYIAASHVIETLTDQWLGKVLAQKVFTPLEITGTYFATEDALAAPNPLAKGYKYDEDAKTYIEVPTMDLDGTSGAGSVLSNVRDYTKWARAVMGRREDILSAKQWNELVTPRSIIDAGHPPFTGPSTYALGWRVNVYRGHRLLHHTGAMHAYGAMLLILPDINYALVAFANTAGSSVFAAYTLLWTLLDDRLDVSKEERFDWDHKNKTALQSGIANARAARSRLYPHLPDPALPLALPLGAYTGTYYDPGYQSLALHLTKNQPSAFLQRFVETESQKEWLVADRKTVTWPEFLTFEHVSADYFIAWAEHEGDYGAWYPEAYPVKFVVGPDGKVSALEIGWEEKMREGRIYMRRVEDESGE